MTQSRNGTLHPRPHRPLRAVLARALVGLATVFGAASSAHAGTAVQFDGTNDYITFGAAPALGLSTFTIECWFKRTGTGVATSTGSGGISALPLVTKGRSEADGTTQDMNWFLGIRGTDGVLVADFEEGAAGASPGLNHPVAGVTPIANGVWYHAAATYDGTSWRLYLNGVLETTLAVSRPPRADSIQRAAVGSALNSTGVASGYFAGVIDEVRVWNGARTTQQILDNKGLEIASASGLVGRWGLNEGVGTTAASSAGTTLNGTLTNGPLWAAGFDTAGLPVVTRGPYLQVGTPTSVRVRWRTDSATNSRVQFGTSAGSLTSTVDDATPTTEHEVELTGLAPSTQYYYSVGTDAATLASGTSYTFRTNPPVGTGQATRIWVLGDSGTKDAVQAAVRDGYLSHAAGRYTDVWLMLGDNAYDNGTDAEYQAAVFDMYPTTLRQSVLWPTIGNHDTAQSTNPALTIPHFQMFTMPTAGEAGGVPSGTEKYYSFDYGRIHFICLDSMTSSRALGSAMLTWLENDLASTTQDWIIAYWHHPPYTKGSHNSDTESQLIQMRTNVLPILEAGGVDLVLTGHSHNYERSYLVDGHYGLSTTFTASMLKDGGNGRENGDGSYEKLPDLAGNQGAVYVVAGNGGHVTNWVGGSTAEFNPAPPPVMYYSALHVGSMAIDVDGNRLDAKMIRETGVVDDYFTIVKNTPTLPPAAPSGLSATAGNAQVVLSWSASSGATGYNVKRATVSGGPYTTIAANLAATGTTDTGVSNGTTYHYVVSALNAGGESGNSGQASATPLPPAPAAPTGLSATAGNAQVSLSWGASSGATGYNVKRATVSGGPYSTIAANVATTGLTDSGVANGTTYHYVVSAVNLGGESANSSQASATPTAPLAPPAAPTGLNATAGNAQVSLAWNASSGATSYTVKRATVSGGPYATLASGLSTTSHIDSSAVNGTTYHYVVSASNAAGEGANSGQASATPTAPATTPAAPGSLVATAASRTQINLAWADNSNNETAFLIERSTKSASGFVQVGTVGAGVTGYASTGLSANKTYYFRVRASNASGNSAYSNTASAKTPR